MFQNRLIPLTNVFVLITTFFLFFFDKYDEYCGATQSGKYVGYSLENRSDAFIQQIVCYTEGIYTLPLWVMSVNEDAFLDYVN